MGKERFIYVSRPELDELHAQRYRALLDCPVTRLSTDGRYVVAPVGVRGYLRISRRDKDGSIVASVRVVTGDYSTTAGYVRNLRITVGSKPATRTIALRLRGPNR